MQEMPKTNGEAMDTRLHDKVGMPTLQLVKLEGDYDEYFNQIAMDTMMSLGLPEDEAQILLDDYNMGY